MRDIHLVSRRDLLDHSFYQRWVAGELSIGELRDYTCQYAFAKALDITNSELAVIARNPATTQPRLRPAARFDAGIVGLGKDHFSAAQRAADAILDGMWDLLTSVERAA